MQISRIDSGYYTLTNLLVGCLGAWCPCDEVAAAADYLHGRLYYRDPHVRLYDLGRRRESYHDQK